MGVKLTRIVKYLGANITGKVSSVFMNQCMVLIVLLILKPLLTKLTLPRFKFMNSFHVIHEMSRSGENLLAGRIIG